MELVSGMWAAGFVGQPEERKILIGDIVLVLI